MTVKGCDVIHHVDCQSSGVENARTDTVNVFMEVLWCEKHMIIKSMML